MTPREKRFIKFASVEYDGQVRSALRLKKRPMNNIGFKLTSVGIIIEKCATVQNTNFH